MLVAKEIFEHSNLHGNLSLKTQIFQICIFIFIFKNRFNHTSWVAFVTPTDCPTSVCNCCVIEVFGGVFCVVTLLFGFFCRCRGFSHRIESDIFLFLFIIKTLMYTYFPENLLN